VKWKTVSFEDGVNSRGSGASGLAQSQWEEGGQYPVIGQGAEFIEGWTNRADLLLAPNPAVVLYGGHTRRAKFVDTPFVPGPNVKILEPKETLDAKFLFYFLAQLPIESRGYADHFPEVRRSSIPLPPLAEQRRIAEVLDRAEALRAKRRAALAQLDSLTQSLFLDLFGDPATNPKGWPKATLGDVTEMITGYPFRSEEYVTNGDSVRLCRGANVLPGRVDWSDLARWPESKTAGLTEFNLEAGDVVIAMDRPWISEGFKIARVQPEDCPALLVQRVARLRGGKKLPNEFLFHLLNQPAFTRHCRPTETTIPHISPKDIRSFAFPVPPIPLRREFARRVTAVEALKTAQRASLAELDALFATLQHRAFRGEL
jgi:type I restriction enzyme, S subunit